MDIRKYMVERGTEGAIIYLSEMLEQLERAVLELIDQHPHVAPQPGKEDKDNG